MYGRVLVLCRRGPQLEPCGVDGLTQAEAAMSFYSNRNSEFVAWFAAQALQCSVRKIATILQFPEDLGRDQYEGLASVWAMLENRSLAGATDTFRGAAFPCQLGIVDQLPPLAILSDLHSPTVRFHTGWLVFHGYRL